MDTCCVSLQRLLGYFLLREGGLGPCLSLCNDRCSWSLVMPRSSSTTVVWLVLLVLTHLALCWLSSCVPFIVGTPKDFGCSGDYTGAVLGQGYCVLYRCRGPDSAENRGVLHAVPDQVVGLLVVCNDSGGLVQTLSQEVPQLQLFFKDVDFPVVAQGPDDL